ncbi:MAG: hypothetical protein ACKOKF_12625 [Bacteroidota bacterium]
MDRRKFIKFGGAFSAAAAVLGASAVQAEKPANELEDLPHFEQGQILTHEQLNALVDRINELNKRA